MLLEMCPGIMDFVTMKCKSLPKALPKEFLTVALYAAEMFKMLL